ncbi:MAG TPA: hypothetical protein PL110_06430 [Candidatus Eremiobacteraeota bacterium]|nr:hypothetical protein [Candidatus Eremiobacteraeota bacterium]
MLDIDEIIKLKAEGLSIRNIAEKLNVKRGVIEYRLKTLKGRVKEETEKNLQHAELVKVNKINSYLNTVETSIFDIKDKIEEMQEYFYEIKQGTEETRDKIALLREFRELIKFAKDFIDSLLPDNIDKFRYMNLVSISILYEEIFKESAEVIKEIQSTMEGKTSEEILTVVTDKSPDVIKRWKERMKGDRKL